MKRMDVLDDAVFAYWALAARVGSQGELPRLENLIAVHSDTLYGAERSPELLHRAWELRRLDPLAARAVERSLQKFGKRATGKAVAEEARLMAATTIDKSLAPSFNLSLRRSAAQARLTSFLVNATL